MKIGRDPRHWTLYGVASLSARPAPSASRVTCSCSSAASRSIENVHSYGYETNGTRSCRRAVTHSEVGSVARTASSSGGAAIVVSTTSPDSTRRASSPLSSNADQSAAPSAESARTIVPPTRKIRPSGSRKDAPSGADALLVGGLFAPKSEETLRAAPVHLSHDKGTGDATDEPLKQQAAGAGIEVREDGSQFSPPLGDTRVSREGRPPTQPNGGRRRIQIDGTTCG